MNEDITSRDVDMKDREVNRKCTDLSSLGVLQITGPPTTSTLVQVNTGQSSVAMVPANITVALAPLQNKTRYEQELESSIVKRRLKSSQKRISGSPRWALPVAMKTLCWNWRGISDPARIKELRGLAREVAPSVFMCCGNADCKIPSGRTGKNFGFC